MPPVSEPDVVKGAKGEKWVCSVCLATSDSDDWEIEAFVSRPAPERDLLVLRCPSCRGSLVYRFLYNDVKTHYPGN